MSFHFHTKGRWSQRLAPRLSKLADLLLNTEPFWVIPALAFTYTSLLWGMNYSWVGLIIASLPFPLRRWREGYFTHRTPFDLPVGLFFIASLIGLFASPDWGLSLRAFQSCLVCILLYYSLANIPHIGYVKWGFAFAGVCILAAILLALGGGFSPPPIAGQFGTWVEEQLQRLPQIPHLSNLVTPTISGSHGLTIALEIILIPLIGISLFTCKLSGRMAAIFFSLLFLILLFLFASQGAWLAVGIAVFLLLLWRSRWLLLPVSAAAGIGYWGFRHEWFDPHLFLSPFNRVTPGSSLGDRIALWQEAIGVIQDHPATGCGLGYLEQFSPTHLSPHNAYLQLYADMGIAGALTFLCALTIGGGIALNLLGSPGTHPWHGFAIGLLVAIVAIGIHGIFEASPAGILAEGTHTYYYVVSPVFSILAGLLVRTQRILQSESITEDYSLPNMKDLKVSKGDSSWQGCAI